MLYGWLEVGASNVPVFASQCNQDIILRTASSNNKILIGTQTYPITSGSNVLAALYVESNNVGLQKLPGSNVRLDVRGNISTDETLYFRDVGGAASNLSAWMTNSNNALQVVYNGTQRMQFTAAEGIRVSDKVYSTEDFHAPAFNIWSDSNFKRNIVKSVASVDASVLEKVGIYDYQLWSAPDRPVKGFVAQQVETCFPQCIQKNVGFIPMSITPILPTKEGLLGRDQLPAHIWDNLEVGERFALMGGGELFIYKMTDSHLYLSGALPPQGSRASIIGKHGFVRSVDTTQLLAVTVNTVKHLMSRVQELEARLAAATLNTSGTDS